MQGGWEGGTGFLKMITLSYLWELLLNELVTYLAQRPVVFLTCQGVVGSREVGGS